MRTREFTRRFWKKVLLEGGDGCWEWQACVDRQGYGRFQDGAKVTLKSHRVSYELTRHKHPGPLCVLHRCDNPGCVRPSHLFLGTVAENNKDMIEKGRQRGCPGALNGRAKLTWEEVGEIRSTKGCTQRELARAFGVTPAAISLIITGKNWKERA